MSDFAKSPAFPQPHRRRRRLPASSHQVCPASRAVRGQAGAVLTMNPIPSTQEGLAHRRWGRGSPELVNSRQGHVMRQRYWILNPKASAIVASLRAEPQRWAVDEWPAFKLVAHDGAGTELLQVWIANGWWFVSIYRPTSEKLGLVGRTLVWLEYRRWLRSENARSQTGDFNHSRNQAAIDALRVS